MFGGSKSKSRAPIGVAVSPDGVRLAQVSASGTGAVLTAAAEAPIDAGLTPGDPGYAEALGSAVSRALGHGPFTGKLAVSAMPADSLHYKNVRLPQMPEGELAQAVAWEAKERIALGEPTAVQFYHAGEVRQGQDTCCEVVLLAAKQSTVDAHVQGLTRAGLMPLAIDATGAALARSIARYGETSFIVNASPSGLEVVIAKGERVLLNKLLHVGEDGLGSAKTDELAREVGLCLRYQSVTFRGDRPAAVTFAGDELHETLRQAITEPLGLPARNLHEAAAFTSGTDSVGEKDLGHWGVAAGLSMRSASTNSGEKRGAA